MCAVGVSVGITCTGIKVESEGELTQTATERKTGPVELTDLIYKHAASLYCSDEFKLKVGCVIESCNKFCCQIEKYLLCTHKEC